MADDHGLVVSVVDDDASVRRSLKNLLTAVGFAVEIFDSPIAFLAAHRRNPNDCVILDLGMPEMSGLDVLIELSSTGSRTPVIVFTGHGDEQERRQCLRAGAVGFFQKSCDIDELLDAIHVAATHGRGLRQSTARRVERSVRLASNTLGAHRHICAFFHDAEEKHHLLRSFVNDGLRAGERSLHIVDPELRDSYLARLAADGHDVKRMIGRGQLEVHPWQEAYLRGDRFEQHSMLRYVEDVLQTTTAVDSAPMRVVAHMEWALLDKPGVEDLVEYEARANYIVSKYDAPVICAYDMSRFSANVVIDVMRTHPSVMIGGVLRENPYFVPPDQLLLEMEHRRSGEMRCGGSF